MTSKTDPDDLINGDTGLTIREYFACHLSVPALVYAAHYALKGDERGEEEVKQFATAAVMAADALIEALNAPRKPVQDKS